MGERINWQQSGFSRGEVSERILHRTDLRDTQLGAKKIENMIVTTQGTVARRGGSWFVREMTGAASQAWLIPFTASLEGSYVLWFGHEKIRFFADRGILVDGALAEVQVTTPYNIDDLTNSYGSLRLKYVQSADTLFLCHPDYPVQELVRETATSFTLTESVFTGGPYEEMNQDDAIICHVHAEDVGQSAWIYVSSPDTFAAEDVGRLFRVWINTAADVTEWEAEATITAGNHRRYEGRYYIAETGGTTGTAPPSHIEGSYYDGSDEGTNIKWTYQDAGFGELRITEIGPTVDFSTSVLGVEEVPVGEDGEGWIRITVAFNTEIQRGMIVEITDSGSEIDGWWRVDLDTGTTFLLYGSDFGTGTAWVSGGTVTVYGGTHARGTVISHIPHSVTTAAPNPDPATGLITDIGTSTRFELGSWCELLGYPEVAAFYNDRLVFAKGNRVWMSVVGDYWNFSIYDKNGEVVADYAIDIKITGGEYSSVRWMRNGEWLIVGTDGGYWAIGPMASSAVFGPGNIQVRPQNANGSADVRPVTVGDEIIYVSRSGKATNFIAYDFGKNAYVSVSITPAAEQALHSGVKDMAFVTSYEPIIWACMKDGTLAGTTYNKAQEVVAFHRHITDGQVESIAVVPSEDLASDDLWLLVAREVDGATTHHLEVMPMDQFPSPDRVDDATRLLYLDDAVVCDTETTVEFTTVGSTTVMIETWAADTIVAIDPVTFVLTNYTPGDEGKVLANPAGDGVALLIGENGDGDYELSILQTFPDGQYVFEDGTISFTYDYGSNLSPLEGVLVDAYVDGKYMPEVGVVTGGTLAELVDFDYAIVGRRYTSTFQTVPINSGTRDGKCIGLSKRIDEVNVGVLASSGGMISCDGENYDSLSYPAQVGTEVPYLWGGDLKAQPYVNWEPSPSITVTTDASLPLHINYIAARVEVNER